VPTRPPFRRPRGALRCAAVAAVALLGALGAAACSSGGGDDGPSLGAQAARGRDLTRREGCTACHTAEGDDSIGPSWQGLHGSRVRLEDGSTVTADDEYLRRAIQEPNAQVREGFRPIMPERRLDDADVEAIVAYLREL